ncbi:UNVERIFIED_CONTAM: hypothetical protein NCL1_38954 [Trichonephila clavipes]
MMNFIIEETIAQLVENIRSEYQENKTLSEGTLSMLSYLFDFTATQALDLVDHRCVSHIISPIIIALVHHSFFMCKHKLAVILSSAMGLCKEVQYADETVTLMLFYLNN